MTVARYGREFSPVGVDQALLDSSRERIAAVGIGSDSGHVLHVVVQILLSDVVPEGRSYKPWKRCRLVVRLILHAGLAGERSRSRCVHHLVDLFLTLQALDVVREVGDFLSILS